MNPRKMNLDTPDIRDLPDEVLTDLEGKIKGERERRNKLSIMRKAEKIRQLCDEINEQGFEIIFVSCGKQLQYDAGTFESLLIRIDD